MFIYKKFLFMKKIVPVILFVALCLLAGYVSRLLQASSLEMWYYTLIQSPLTPPAAVFPVVWSVLYILMGVAAGILWGERSIYSRLLFTLFSLQLLFNIAWSFCFFYMQSPLMGLVVILVKQFSLSVIPIFAAGFKKANMSLCTSIERSPYPGLNLGRSKSPLFARLFFISSQKASQSASTLSLPSA